jgi:hypothetical protein
MKHENVGALQSKKRQAITFYFEMSLFLEDNMHIFANACILEYIRCGDIILRCTRTFFKPESSDYTQSLELWFKK